MAKPGARLLDLEDDKQVKIKIKGFDGLLKFYGNHRRGHVNKYPLNACIIFD